MLTLRSECVMEMGPFVPHVWDISTNVHRAYGWMESSMDGYGFIIIMRWHWRQSIFRWTDSEIREFEFFAVLDDASRASFRYVSHFWEMKTYVKYWKHGWLARFELVSICHMTCSYRIQFPGMDITFSWVLMGSRGFTVQNPQNTSFLCSWAWSRVEERAYSDGAEIHMKGFEICYFKYDNTYVFTGLR